ncbi:hypothetical protein AKJ16_DCAP03406 [Drosera capensis]
MCHLDTDLCYSRNLFHTRKQDGRKMKILDLIGQSHVLSHPLSFDRIIHSVPVFQIFPFHHHPSPMAATTTTSLLPLLLLASLAAAVAARPGRPFYPCSTLLISTHSISSSLPLHRRFSFVAQIREFHHPIAIQSPEQLELESDDRIRASEFFTNPSFDEDMIIRRPGSPIIRDIGGIVVSLLFGAACGVIAAGIMYFVWSLFDNGRRGGGDYYGLGGVADRDDDVFNPKKPANGYVVVPASPVAVEAANSDDPVKEWKHSLSATLGGNCPCDELMICVDPVCVGVESLESTSFRFASNYHPMPVCKQCQDELASNSLEQTCCNHSTSKK